MPGVCRILCHACAHYYVTWDERFPHGCRRMGFKSRRMPNDEVRAAMRGADCRLYSAKRAGRGPGSVTAPHRDR